MLGVGSHGGFQSHAAETVERTPPATWPHTGQVSVRLIKATRLPNPDTVDGNGQPCSGGYTDHPAGTVVDVDVARARRWVRHGRADPT